MNTIPKSLVPELTKQLTNIILSAETKSLDIERTRKIIYLWRQDSLQTDEGVKLLLSSALTLSPEETHKVIETLGIAEAISILV